MTMNIGGMGMGGMNMMGNTTGAGSVQNVPQYFQAKYGCEDCFRKEPYWNEYPKPVQPEPKNSLNPSFMKRLLHNILGG